MTNGLSAAQEHALDETARWLAANPEPPEYVSDPGDEPEPDWWERCEDAVQAVRRLHRKVALRECHPHTWCYTCGLTSPWPCPTERAIVEALGET